MVLIPVLARSAFALLVCAAFSQAQSDPWPPADLIEPAALAKLIQLKSPPLMISVAFPVLYRSKHLPHAIDAGAASRPEGIASLHKLLADLPVDTDVVIYCGCCPMEKCPNIRPAYLALKDKGFKRIRVLDIPTNMHTDWYSKNYPSELGKAATNPAK